MISTGTTPFSLSAGSNFSLILRSIYRRPPASLLALARRRAEAAPSAHALTESFPFFRRHVFPALPHATAKFGALPPVPAKIAEENPAQHQNPQRLPERDLAPAKQPRQQPIPQLQHHFATDKDKQHHRHNRQRTQVKPFLVHIR